MAWITDTHCHLNFDIYQTDLEDVLHRAEARGIRRILVPGVDLDTSRTAVSLASRYTDLYAAVGIHPEALHSWDESSLYNVQILAQSAKVRAIGEIGMDYYHDDPTLPAETAHTLQQDIFLAQLRLAGELGLPVVLHQRACWDDFWSVVEQWLNELQAVHSPLLHRPGVLHSFDGSLAAAEAAIAAGFYIGISGPVTFKNAQERQALVAQLPLDHLLIETDSPYLTPHPLRGRWPNEPANVALVAEKVAALHEQPLETVIQITWQNAVQLFDWGANS